MKGLNCIFIFIIELLLILFLPHRSLLHLMLLGPVMFLGLVKQKAPVCYVLKKSKGPLIPALIPRDLTLSNVPSVMQSCAQSTMGKVLRLPVKSITPKLKEFIKSATAKAIVGEATNSVLHLKTVRKRKRRKNLLLLDLEKQQECALESAFLETRIIKAYSIQMFLPIVSFNLF